MGRGVGYGVAMLAVAGAVFAGLACGKKAEPAGPYAYAAGDLEGFEKVLAGGGWKVTDPPRNAQGMLTAVHERTGLTFVLVPGGIVHDGLAGRRGGASTSTKVRSTR